MRTELKNTKNKIEELEKICDDNIIDEKLKDIIINFKNGKEFDNETIKILINRIEVYEDKTIDISFNI